MNKGITLIALIITIIIMLILTTVTINMGTGSVENSKMLSFITYMQAIQKKVDLLVENDDYLNYGQELTDENKQKLQLILDNQNETFFTTINSAYLRFFNSNNIATDLEIDNIYDDIIVDFNTREVISLNGISYENKTYYSQYYLPGGQAIKQQSEIVRNVNFDEIQAIIDGLNATFKITNIGITNGTLSFGQKDENNEIKWNKITNYTKEGETITTNNITKSGTYYFKLVDNVTGEDNIDEYGNYPSLQLRLTNNPKLEGDLSHLSTVYNYSDLSKSENWAYATDATNTEEWKYYVWIPRFAYETANPDNIQFLRGTSDITTSGGYINNTDWTETSVFANGTSKKTGVWVKVDEPNQTRYKHN